MPILKKDLFQDLDAFPPQLRATAALQEDKIGLHAGIVPGISIPERKLEELAIPVYPVNNLVPPPDDMNQRLTLLAGDLTDEGELGRLLERVKHLAQIRALGGGLPKPIHVLGHGAEYSDRYPYRSPKAQALRAQLWPAYATMLLERPKNVRDLNGARRYMADYFRRVLPAGAGTDTNGSPIVKP